MAKNKDHWYDGWFYDWVIAPNQDELFGLIKEIIQSQKKIIDVGCGTGRLEFALADKCEAVLGIDLSKRNIDRAKLNLLQYPVENISFEHGELNDILKNGQSHFDYAILTFVIHEVDKEERIRLLNLIAESADRVIIGDYTVPKPNGIGGFVRELIEFLAGSDHYRNYKSYMADGGINYLARESGLRITSENKNNSSSNHIAVLEK
jgi:SAM-dependent methyltransferase